MCVRWVQSRRCKNLILRILIRRSFAEQTPQSPEPIIGWLEAVACEWNDDPTPLCVVGLDLVVVIGAGQDGKLWAVQEYAFTTQFAQN
jgi:hypothetical protein